jgi:Ca-activated chloride channel family protein
MLDLQLPVLANMPASVPPPAVLEALSRLSQYQMQERAWQQAASGDVAGAVDRLKTLGTRLVASGQPELARLALTEALRIEETRAWSEDVKKELKYGTRALIAAPGPSRRR